MVGIYHLLPRYLNSVGFAFICKWGEWFKLALKNRWSSLGDFPWFLFIYLHLFYHHTITYSVFNPQVSPTHTWWDWLNLPAPQAFHIPKQFLLCAYPPWKFLFSHCSLAMNDQGVPLPFPLYNPETFSKSAGFAKWVGKEEGMFIAFNSFFA